MGNKCGKGAEKTNDTSKLEELIMHQNDIILKLREQNVILSGGNEKYSFRDGMVQRNDVDIAEKINDTKRTLNYKYLVLSGGGLKGISYCGALEVLDECGILGRLKGYAGVSAGSITASLLALGFSAKEIKDMVTEIDFKALVDDKLGYVRDGVNLVTDYGIAPGNAIYDLMGKYIEGKVGNPDYTLSQLYKDKGIKLVIAGTNLSKRDSVYFYHIHDMPIRKAIRISMSIPFLFEPCKTDDGMYCVDGGLLDNYPLHVFDGRTPDDLNSRMNLSVPNHKVLGLNIMTQSNVEDLLIGKEHKIESLFDFCNSMVQTFMIDNERRTMTPSYWLRTINIQTKDYGTTDFSLTKEQKEELMQNGRDGVRDFFGIKEGQLKVFIGEECCCVGPDTFSQCPVCNKDDSYSYSPEGREADIGVGVGEIIHKD